MSATWDLFLTDDEGRRLATLNDNGGFTLVLRYNGTGQFSIQLNYNMDWAALGIFSGLPDNRIEFWRATPEVKRQLLAVGFIRKANITDTALTISGPDQNGLLDTRIIAYDAGTSQTDKTDYADDMMKAVVYDNMGGGAPAGRDLTDYGFGIAGDLGLGPSIDMQFAWRPVRATLDKIAKVASENGTRIYYGIEPVSPTEFLFKTWVGQPGIDRTSDLVFSIDRGLADPSLTLDYQQEITYVYAGGQGQGAARDVQEVEDTARSSASIFGRREGFRDARHVTAGDSDAVEDAGYGMLAEGRPTRLFMATILSVPSAQYGRDWNLGDRVTAQFCGMKFECLISKVRVVVRGDGSEEITAQLEWEA